MKYCINCKYYKNNTCKKEVVGNIGEKDSACYQYETK